MKLIACLFVLAITSLLNAADTLSVGFAEVDVTPVIGKTPVYLAGFGQGRKATRVHDPLMARAVVLGDGRGKIAIVSVDVVGVFLTSVERIRSELPGFQYVLVSATHNHEGPDTLGLWGPNPLVPGLDADYLAKLEAGCVAAVKQASASLKPAVVKIGTAKAPELIRDNRLPEVKHDDLVAIEFLDPKTDAALGTIVQWNCHPEVLDSKNTEITADFVGYAVRKIRERRKAPVVYLTGTVGGLMTTLRLKVTDAAGKELSDGTFEKAERYGELLAELADRALASAVPATLTPFTVKTQRVLLPIDNNLYRLAWKLGTLRRPIFRWDGEPTPRDFVESIDIAKPVAVRSEVGYLKLGELEVAVIPGEIYPELVLDRVQNPVDPGADYPMAAIEPAIYPAMKAKHRILIGLGNDELGYILPKRQWDEKPPYCYGLKKAQYGEENSLGPETGPILCKVFRDLVNR